MDVSYRRIINKGIIENAITNRCDIFHLSKTTNKREAVYDKKKTFYNKILLDSHILHNTFKNRINQKDIQLKYINVY